MLDAVQLTSEEIILLTQHFRKSQSILTRERAQVILAFNEGVTSYQLSVVMRRSEKTIRRVTVENNKLYMYPLTISNKAKQQLFLELAKTTHELKTKPHFYNTLVSNCTNELAKAANKVKPGSIPLDISLILPGYSLKLLYKLGYVPTNLPLEELPKKYYISDIVRQIYQDEDFSKKLREKIKQ